MDMPIGPVTPAFPLTGTRAEDIMERIADVLGRPTTDFRSGKPRGMDADAIDLLECWMALRTEPARARVLATARAAVAAQMD